MIRYNWTTSPRNYQNAHTRYAVVGGRYGAKTDTLGEAKTAGARIAKMEAYRGKWNHSILAIVIDKQRSPGSIFYSPTGWRMYVPVAGTGKKYALIEANILRQFGVPSFRWTRK